MLDFNGEHFYKFEHGYTNALYRHVFGDLKIPLDLRKQNPDSALFDLMADDAEQMNARKIKHFRMQYLKPDRTPARLY